MYDTILVPTDGSDHALRAAEHAGMLARAFDATVHVVSVVDVQAEGGVFDAGGISGEFLDHLDARARESVESTVERIGGGEAGDREPAGGGDEGRVRTDVVRGSPGRAILDYADEHGADLVVMGTHGRTGVHRFVAGSVAERVLRLSPVPVLTVRAVEGAGTAGGYDEVLVPTDGSEAADTAVDHALAVAGAFGARVHAVNVVELGAFATDASTPPSPGMFEHLESIGEEATESVATRAREAGLDAVTEVRTGSPGQGLLDYADEHGIDLIAMGTHGRGGIERLLLGSTTERVVRRADAPVLTVRPDEHPPE